MADLLTDTARSAAHLAIDMDAFLQRCAGKRSMALLLLSEWETSGQKQVRDLMDAAAAGRCAAVAELAHSLKGAAGIMSAGILQTLAYQIELAAKQHDLASVQDLLEALLPEMNHCLAYCREYRQQAVGLN